MHDQREPQAPLNGWKEIAAYLGKSVRSVQRWEATLGLPVHRIRTPDGQIVYSERREIDDWRRQLEAQPVAEPEDPANPEALPEAIAPPGPDRRHIAKRLAPVWLVAVGIVLIGIGLIAGRSISPRPPGAFSVEFAGRSLQGLNSKGEVVWSFGFDRDVTGGHLKPRLIDLEGDGALEWIVPVVSAVRGTVSDAIYCFTQGGALRWKVQADETLTYNGRKVTPPWLLVDFEVAPAVPRRVWAAFARGEGPNFILEINASGSSHMRYFQAGPIATLHHWQTPSGAFLVAGGFSQKHARPSIVLLAEHGPAAFFPYDPVGMSSRPSCIECPAGSLPAHCCSRAPKSKRRHIRARLWIAYGSGAAIWSWRCTWTTSTRLTSPCSRTSRFNPSPTRRDTGARTGNSRGRASSITPRRTVRIGGYRTCFENGRR